MKDPIERQAIINELESWLKVEGYSEGELNIIKAVLYELQSLPSAKPKIVRCKDCKFWKKYGYINGKPEFLPKCGFNQIYTGKDDFCSRAERKNNG